MRASKASFREVVSLILIGAIIRAKRKQSLHSRSLKKDSMWVASTQILAATGQLAGIRILTEVLSPSTFGELSLWLGAILLMASGLANPTMQALLKFYPASSQKNQQDIVRTVAARQLVKLVLWIAPVLMPILAAAIYFSWASGASMALVGALIAVEMVRMQYMAILNAIREHKVYGIWSVLDAWGRPIAAWLLVNYFGENINIVLTAFFLASTGLLFWVRQWVPDSGDRNHPSYEELSSRFWRYTLPLLPLGVIGWISGMADRYLLGALMNTRDVGIYVAIYGLVSRPMLMISTMAETSIRPVYYDSVTRGDAVAARKYLLMWSSVVLLAAIAMSILLSLLHQQIAHLFLGPDFREGSHLMFWIAIGYGCLALYHIPARICLAHDAPHFVTITEMIGALLSVAVGFIFINAYGLVGAAIAIPFYYGAQLIISIFFAIQAVNRKSLVTS